MFSATVAPTYTDTVGDYTFERSFQWVSTDCYLQPRFYSHHDQVRNCYPGSHTDLAHKASTREPSEGNAESFAELHEQTVYSPTKSPISSSANLVPMRWTSIAPSYAGMSSACHSSLGCEACRMRSASAAVDAIQLANNLQASQTLSSSDQFDLLASHSSSYGADPYPIAAYSHPSPLGPAGTIIAYQCQYDCNTSPCYKSVGTTRAEVTQHLRDYHGVRGYHARVLCFWHGCKMQKQIRGDSLSRHIVGHHMQASRVRCSRCFKIFSRLESLRKHTVKDMPCEGANPIGSV
ncbi:hypothetical protein BV22DRAFT_494536 [Leucogyrophana mollusca]|uniref:Uncharacterized protein n=1 Tax=Leucogyrophana mollusca TaxID=85980 RepID=A0ACB8BGP6_9AGAM|nr:hypothetical protein BV22DRAFT_494536 [Leucogyrophana mollusca]